MLEMAKISFPDVTDKDIIVRLNEALLEWCEATDYLVKADPIAAGAVFPKNLPTDFAREDNDGVVLFNTDGTVADVEAQVYIAHVDMDQSKYRLYDRSDKRWINNLAASFLGTMKWFYVAKPTVLDDTTLAQIPVIPSQYHSALVYRAIEPYFLAKRDLAMAQFCALGYAESIRAGKRMARMQKSRIIHSPSNEMEM